MMLCDTCWEGKEMGQVVEKEMDWFRGMYPIGQRVGYLKD
jgi:hypothetical protein